MEQQVERMAVKSCSYHEVTSSSLVEGVYFFKMEEERNMPHKKHVFVCVNEREQGSCCQKVGGFEAFKELKQFTRDNNLIADIWVTKTGCMGFCNDTGCTI